LTAIAHRGVRPLPVDGRPALVLLAGSIVGGMAFGWPLIAAPDASGAVRVDSPLLFVAILPILVVVSVAELASGRLDAKGIAMLGVLAALGAALRPMGAGTAGVETVFVILILGGRVFGPGFGFVLGPVTLFASALLTGGVGPWLPFQMLAAGWVGLGAGLLPRARGFGELALLTVYGAIAAFAYGLAMNLWFWPFAVGVDTSLSFVAGDPLVENLVRFLLFTAATSMAWDAGRAITTVVLLAAFGPPVLAALRRAARRAAFGERPRFAPASGIGGE
jgi:energy-coupling factor transport system substrate-specific component